MSLLDTADPEARAYRDHRPAVLKMLARRFRTLSEDQRLELYHDAWERMLRKQRDGEPIRSPLAYLVETAYREALHGRARVARTTPVSPGCDLLADLEDAGEPIEERVEILDEARIARELIATLEPRQRSLVKLRWDLQLEADEVRDALGLSRKQYLRLSELAAKAIAERVTELHDGTWSARQRSLLTAALLRVTVDGERRAFASETRRAEAQRLLASDPHVAALFADVERIVGRAAALAPLPAVGGDRSAALSGLADVAAAARAQLGDWAAAAKQQAASASVRASDPTPLAGARPGTAVAAIAGCLAVGGGTYCAVEGLPESLRGPLGIERRDESRPISTTKPRQARQTDLPAEPVSPQTSPQPTAPPPVAPVPVAEPSPAPPPEPAAPPPAPAEQSFGIEQAAPSSQPAPPPAPAPPSGGGGGGSEFGFER